MPEGDTAPRQPSTEPPETAAESAARAWAGVLSELWDEAGTADRAGEPGPPPAEWHPPAGLGPLPLELAERAERVIARLATARETVRAGERGIAAHLELLRSAPQTASGSAVYLDARG